ncbi:N-acetylmuramoyl-L-alanine amidase family protein [Sphingomicrobium lutaoense]|uniref:N-acetylmuramoyl-L-alanine amidase n=1 Tax=Sphingomicrobium lutaoense TaxID=515949 RepID=A0A839Z2G2_9SPHN|nr:N-acetylmuramoyl-L-alanine amidase [Sphingomicrobium lutaoense]MBB3764237.1 N-acetylmuramoyl-L-alanine amidase [Sphingomicrobium lutaoense]
MTRRLLLAAFIVGAAVLAFIFWPRFEGAPSRPLAEEALVGEARQGGLTVALPEAVGNVEISDARLPGQPLVLIDPGHGGVDGGATGLGGRLVEKRLTLAMAREVRERLVERGRVRTALTRDGDDRLTLEQRAAIARRIGADLFVSIHMDSAPNPEAVGVTLYALSDVASSEEAADLAAAEARRIGPVVSTDDSLVEALLTDLALREQMEASHAFARRVLRRARGSVPLRPTPVQSANFHVLRRAQVPGILVEAGYLTNQADAERLAEAEGRATLVRALADAIEADLATRQAR